MQTRWISVVAIALSACGSSAPAAEQPAPSSSTVAPSEPAAPAEPAGSAEPDYIAPPFTKDDLRTSIPAGTELKLRISAAGQPTVIQHWVFTASDASGCTIAARILAEDGTTLIKDEGEGTSTWAELETHGRFPAARTARTDASVDVEAGHFDTWLFVVQPEKPGGPIKKVHFARTLPGPPVLMEVTQGDELLMKMELVSRTQPE